MNYIFQNLKSALSRKFRAKRIKMKHNELSFTKVIYSMHHKEQKQVYQILNNEVENLKRLNPGYSLLKFSDPMNSGGGSILYVITLIKKPNGKGK